MLCFYKLKKVCGNPALSKSIGDIFQWNLLTQCLCLEKEMQATLIFLPEKSHGQRSLVGYSPKCLKELNVTEQLSTYVSVTFC